MQLHYEWLSLISSFLWALAFIIAVLPSNHLGSIAFNRWRMLFSCLILGTASLTVNGYHGITVPQILTMCLSGAVGICIGDVALFASFNRLGPRLSGILFSTHAFFSVIIGILFFSESLSLPRVAGILLIFTGVSLTLYFSEEKQTSCRFAVSKISVTAATALGLLSGLCQALGIAIAKPVVEAGINPVAASSIRMFCAYGIHLLILMFFYRTAKARKPLTSKILFLIFINAFIAIGLGMTLVLKAVDNGNLGLVAILSSCSPVMILPIMWIYYHKKPQLSSWLSAMLVVIGTGIIFNF